MKKKGLFIIFVLINFTIYTQTVLNWNVNISSGITCTLDVTLTNTMGIYNNSASSFLNLTNGKIVFCDENTFNRCYRLCWFRGGKVVVTRGV